MSMFPKEGERERERREYSIAEFGYLRVKENSGRADWLVTIWNQSGTCPLPPSQSLLDSWKRATFHVPHFAAMQLQCT